MKIDDLVIEIASRRVVDGISLSIAPSQTLGLVGESGSGKTMTALSILELLPPEATVTRGRFTLQNKPISDRKSLRGRTVGMVFQEPLTALNPVYTVGDQIEEALLVHRPEAPYSEVLDALTEVGIPTARAADHPHALSGGMRQRVMIAMALIARPSLLIADEPTTALDVTVQAQVLALIARLQADRKMAMLLVSHDLAVVASTCQDVAVMYAGRIVERGKVGDVLARPLHPYTAGLIASRPENSAPGVELPTIPGKISAILPSGCRFRDRCAFATAACAEEPPLVTRDNGHQAWCVNPRG